MRKPEIEIPTNDCKGCMRRDEIIQGLAARIDELEGNATKLQLAEAVEEEAAA